MEPKIRYATSGDGTRIAYAVEAGTPPAILLIWGWPQTIGAPSYTRVAPGRAVVHFDRRGMGASSRDVQDISIDRQVEDVASIVTALGGQPVDIRANWDGTPIAIAFAAAQPECVERMALLDPYIRGSSVTAADALRALMDLARNNWPMLRRSMGSMIPGRDAAAWSEALRRAVSPDMAARYLEQYGAVDVSSQIERVQAPTLVVYQSGNGAVPRRAVQETASRLQHCEFVEVASMEAIAEPVNRFLDREAPLVASVADPVDYAMAKPSAFRTVLFTDLVGHTEMMSRLGDEKGRDVLRQHERITREVLKANGGTEVKTMGDGFMASFGSVTKAVECAIALQRAFADREGEPLNVRVGLNAGEPIEEDGDLFGATVILASRIAAKAGGGEILVADTVRGLCSGKGFLFADRGEFVAKGIEEPVRISEVSWRS
jgi:class 3 adenylate cyclase